MKVAYLALGSNLGAREANLDRARALLTESGVRVLAASALYETEPQGLANQPWFLNQALRVETELFPRQLLLRVKKIERSMGRIRTVRNGPRVIDIDILLYADVAIDTKELKIPHPRMSERRFVLEPLAEIAPGLKLPGSKHPLRDQLPRLSAQSLRKL